MEDTQKGYKDLPEGKLYHIFVSYKDCENDRGWVRQLIDIFQSDYKLICCDHAIDFQPGRKIIENIKYAITHSVKTLVMLSEEYNDSYWCQLEIEFALFMNMDMRENLLIPVLKENCEIPDYLKPLTYIDGRGGDIKT